MRHKFLATVLTIMTVVCTLVVPTYATEYVDGYNGVYVLEDGTILDSADFADIDYLLEEGYYELVCDYEITFDDGTVKYIPSFLIEEGFKILYLVGDDSYGGKQATKMVATNGDAPYIQLYDESQYYRTWVSYKSNTADIDTYLFQPQDTSGTTISAYASASTSGFALADDTDGGYVGWSNYDVLDADGNLYHANSVPEPEPEPDTGGEAVTVDMTETNTILMSILFMLGIWVSASIFKSLIGR